MVELDYSTQDFGRIAAIVKAVAGIRMPESNQALVYSRLARRIRDQGFERFSDYIDRIETGPDAAECTAMVEALTTNTTRFFREDYHYDTFVRELLPDLAEHAAAGGRVRLWSAACSSGEEAYSLAAVVLKHFPEAPRHDFRILATDISGAVLDTAKAGLYPSASAASVPDDLARIMFEPQKTTSGDLSIRPDLRDMISFRYMNLMDPWPVRGPFAAVYCRNVMIYMEEQTQARVWAALAEVIPQGGYLFIGHSERIGPEFRDRYELTGKTTFRRL